MLFRALSVVIGVAVVGTSSTPVNEVTLHIMPKLLGTSANVHCIDRDDGAYFDDEAYGPVLQTSENEVTYFEKGSGDLVRVNAEHCLVVREKAL